MIFLAQIEPITGAIIEVADKEPIQQLTFALILLALAGLVLMIVFGIIEMNRSKRDKSIRDETKAANDMSRAALTEMIAAVKMSAEAQSNLAGWRDVIEASAEKSDKSIEMAEKNIEAVTKLTDSINRLVESEGRSVTKSGEVGNAVAALQSDMRALIQSNGERMEAIERLSEEFAAAHERGNHTLGEISAGMTEIRKLLIQMDGQFLEMKNRIDTAFQSSFEQKGSPA